MGIPKQKKQEAEKEPNKTGKYISFRYLIPVGIVVIFGGMVWIAYGTNTSLGKKMAAGIARIMPIPAVLIEYTHTLSAADVRNNLESVKKFYENQDFSASGLRVDFSTEIGKRRLKLKEKEILNKMLEDRAIMLLAEENGIEVSQADIDFNVAKKLDEYGVKKDAIEGDLQRLYGWSLDDFKRKVVKQSLYMEALEKKITPQLVTSEKAKARITAAKQELDSGKNFSEVAKEYSEGFSAQQGGEVGWIAKDQLVEGLQDALFPQKGNPRSGQIVESSLGYHIVEVEETKNAGTGSGDVRQLLRIRQIFISKPSFATWLEERMKEMTVWVGVPGYHWNKQSATVEFDDEDMVRFERDYATNPDRDASLVK